VRLPVLLFALAQGQALQVTASLDRSRVAVGEEFSYTVKAIGHSTAPFRVELPPLDGLELLDRSERTDVVVGTTQVTRAFTLTLLLRAEQVGTWSIGAIRVEQGDASGFTHEETVSVTSASSSSAASGLEPDLLALIPRVPWPRYGRPSVYLVASADRVFAGDQVNVLTAAWLPRSLRLRLRQAPTLTPPALASVWSTPRRAVPGAVASRVMEGETYDLYVSFQTAYPLNPGSLTIPPARLAWVQPSGRQSAGIDRRESVESAPLLLSVRPLPDAGRPAAFDGPVAHDLQIEYELGASSGRAGVALPVDIVVSGAGNLPLWPPPTVSWPATVRVYQEGTENSPRLSGLRMGGSKKFRFGIVPDSAGSLALPPLEYPYFDPGSATYRSAQAPAIVVPVLEPLPVADRRNPLPVLQPGYRTLAQRLIGLPPFALLSLIGFPPLLMLAATLWRRRAPRVRAAAPAETPAASLEALVYSLVPPGTPAAPRALIAALRQAGLPRAEAERLVRLHLTLEAQRFAPAPPPAPSNAALDKEVESVLAALPRRIRRAAGIAAVWLLALCSRGAAQAGLDLYVNGDYAAAARAFRAEAETAPATLGRWYDLAAAEYLAHHDAQAVAALLPARALAPRDERVRLLWNALGREHEQLRRTQRVWPLAAEECFALALLGLWLGALLFVGLSRRRVIWMAVLVLAAGFAVMGAGLRAQRAGLRAVLAGGVSLRTSPHGLAPERGTLPGFSIVRLERRLGSWWLVRAANGVEGWVPVEILAPSPALN
jgi:hypothetical protein